MYSYMMPDYNYYSFYHRNKKKNSYELWLDVPISFLMDKPTLEYELDK